MSHGTGLALPHQHLSPLLRETMHGWPAAPMRTGQPILMPGRCPTPLHHPQTQLAKGTRPACATQGVVLKQHARGTHACEATCIVASPVHLSMLREACAGFSRVMHACHHVQVTAESPDVLRQGHADEGLQAGIAVQQGNALNHEPGHISVLGHQRIRLLLCRLLELVPLGPCACMPRPPQQASLLQACVNTQATCARS